MRGYPRVSVSSPRFASSEFDRARWAQPDPRIKRQAQPCSKPSEFVRPFGLAWEMLLGPPKSKAGRRIVGIPDAIIPALRAHMSVFVKDEPGALVFPGAMGGPRARSGHVHGSGGRGRDRANLCRPGSLSGLTWTACCLGVIARSPSSPVVYGTQASACPAPPQEAGLRVCPRVPERVAVRGT
jgi:hypothetical protein